MQVSVAGLPFSNIFINGRFLFHDFCIRSSRPEKFCKKGVLRNFTKFTGKLLCQSLFLLKLQAQACNFNKKETLAQVFSCGFCEISKNTILHRTSLMAASVVFQAIMLAIKNLCGIETDIGIQ